MKNTTTIFSSAIESNVTPATGCTEPGAVALAAAAVRAAMHGAVQRIEVEVDLNLYKNGADVYIPGTTFRGLDYAAALGLMAGDPAKGLDALFDADRASIVSAERIVLEGKVDVRWRTTGGRLYVRVRIITSAGAYLGVIIDKHDNLVYNGPDTDMYDFEQLPPPANEKAVLLSHYALEDFLDHVLHASPEEKDLARRAVDINMTIARSGLDSAENPAYRISQGLSGRYQPFGKDALPYPAKLVLSAVYERMIGRPVQVMALGGSGNQGLSAVLPVAGSAELFGLEEERLIQSILLCFLIAISGKEKLGLLSSVCSAASVSSSAAGGAIVYLLGGSVSQVLTAIRNTLAATAGMLCDGAKCNCALKAAAGAQAAVTNALLALEDVDISGSSGILGNSLSDCFKNYALMTDGTGELMDSTVVGIIQGKRGFVG